MWAFVATTALYNWPSLLYPQHLSTVGGTFSAAKNHPICLRKTPSSPLAPGSNKARNYHAFDNVLLIVFFSHERYDVNLDYHKEVYSEYFPNVRWLLVLSKAFFFPLPRV